MVGRDYFIGISGFSSANSIPDEEELQSYYDLYNSIYNEKDLKYVTNPFNQDELDKIRAEGKERYDKQIPPGFCDAKKAVAGAENNAYGDLIVWKEILAYATTEHKDIIYVTHDQKRDWWEISKGKTVGPRVELRKEFFDKTKQKFYMYSMESFLEQYSNLEGKIPDRSVIEEVTHIEKEAKKKKKNKTVTSYDSQLALKRSIAELQERIDRRQRAITRLQVKYNGRQLPVDVAIQLENTEKKKQDLQRQLDKKLAKLETYDYEMAGR